MADRVLITGARAGAALDLARDFAAAGWEVHLADSSPARMARWSRVPAAVHRYAPPALDRDGFRRDMDALAARLSPRLIVPVCEEVFHLAAWARASGQAARLFAPPLATLAQLHDKLAFARLCEAAGLPVPESAEFDPAMPLSDPQEWVFKPRFSRFGGATLTGPDHITLARHAAGMRDGWMMQRLVRGNEVSFYAVARAGELVAFTAYRSDWRLVGGASFAFQLVGADLAPQLRETAAALAQQLSITGQFACDAIVDEAGRPWLIECNPRATSGVHLLAGDGTLARAIAAGQPAMPGTASPAYVGPVMFTYGLPMALRRRDLHGWAATMREGRDAIGIPGDRLPSLGALADGLRFTLQGWRHGISATAATTRDIEWNGEDLA